MDSELDSGAEYGALPFDQFALALWDYAVPLQQGQEQWNMLAKKWLSMSRADRSPYWDIHFPGDPPPPDAPYLPTQEQSDCVLAPHQTAKERNLSLHTACLLNDPVWIRACYATNLQGAYEETIEAGLRESEDPHGLLVLDNEDLYGGYGEDWEKIFLRLPLLPDAVRYYGGVPQPDDDISYAALPTDEKFMPLYNASLKDKQVVYVVDEQALKNKLVKLMYVDIHGHAVWQNTIAPEDIWQFEANYYKGGMLSMVREMCDLDGDESLLHPGAQLRYYE